LPTPGRLLLLVRARRGAGPLHRGAAPAVAFAVAAALAAAAVGRLGAPSSAPGGRARGRKSRGGSGGGGECSCWGILAVLHGEFLEDEVVAGLQEGGEGSDATKKCPNVAEAFVEAADDIEDEGVIGDDLTKSGEIIGHLLQLAAIVGDGEERSPWTKLRNCISRWMERASRLPRNCDSTASQACRAVEPWAEMISARSSVSVATIQDLTTQSIRAQSGEGRAGGSS
jgi:hypothetical protein